MRKLLNALCALVVFAAPILAVDMSREIDAATVRVMPQVVEWRRFIHAHPELGNRETATSKLVADKLRAMGIEVRTGIAKTGVVGILKGGQPGPVIGLRADMDGLPVTERTDVPFRSTVKAEFNGQTVGVMHACGHDAHVAMLLGTATVLSGMKDKIKGTVVFIFQPAEEGPPAGEEGGAPLMVKEGVMDDPKVDAVFGIHMDAKSPIGTIEWKSGSAMAASDWFTIKVRGRQAHGAYPWEGVDPIAVATQIYTGLQMIVARESNLPKAPVIITVGKLVGGVRENIIPEEMSMSGTIRTLDSEMQKEVHQKIRLTAAKIAESMGATAEVTIDTKALVTYNTLELVKRMLPSLEKAAGKENLIETPWVTGAEDFSYFGTKAPSFYFWIGGLPKGKTPEQAASHHTPDFYIDDSRLDVGIKAFCNIVIDYEAATRP
jgi:amidohydrolase